LVFGEGRLKYTLTLSVVRPFDDRSSLSAHWDLKNCFSISHSSSSIRIVYPRPSNCIVTVRDWTWLLGNFLFAVS